MMNSEELMQYRRQIANEPRLLPALLADAIVSVQELEDELSNVQPILGAEQQEVIRQLTNENADAMARVRELESLLSIACNELFGGVVARPYQIEKMRAWHRLYTTMKDK